MYYGLLSRLDARAASQLPTFAVISRVAASMNQPKLKQHQYLRCWRGVIQRERSDLFGELIAHRSKEILHRQSALEGPRTEMKNAECCRKA